MLGFLPISLFKPNLNCMPINFRKKLNAPFYATLQVSEEKLSTHRSLYSENNRPTQTLKSLFYPSVIKMHKHNSPTSTTKETQIEKELSIKLN